MGSERCELVDRATAVEAIGRMNEDDLRFLNRLIVERLKLISQARSTVMLARFTMGDRVRFQANSGEWKSGVILRLNKKTASIVTDDGQRWNVHPGFLTPVDSGNVEPSRGSPGWIGTSQQ